MPLRDATEQWSTKRGLTSLNLTGQAPSVAAECCTLVRFEKRINMFDQKPPPWGTDPLSTFFSEAEHNDRVTSLKLASVYALLQRAHAAFQRVGEAV